MSTDGRHRAPPRFPFAVVLVALVVLAGLIVGVKAVFFGDDDGKDPAAASTSAPTSPGTTGGRATGGPTTREPTTGGEPSSPRGGRPSTPPPPARPKQALVIPRARGTNIDPAYIGVSPPD